MGTLQSNLVKILKLVRGTEGSGTALLVFCILFLASIQNVSTRSVSETETVSSSFQTETTTVYSTTTSEPWEGVITSTLDMDNPKEVVLRLMENATTHKFNISGGSNKFFIAIHLKSCDLDLLDSIDIIGTGNNKITSWHCPSNSITSERETLSPDFVENHNFENADHSSNPKKHSGDKFANVEHVENLKEVWIKPRWNKKKYSRTEAEERKRNEHVKATIVINLYIDIPGSNSCPGEYFNCRQTPCSTTNCCNMSPSGSGSNSNQKSASNIFTTTFGSKVGSENSRCISNALKCNGNPNCGMYNNIDESNQICYPETYCQCDKELCLTLNYVLTSLAIAILFIITPTAIVFALFHRRNVALERARLIRLAQMRMAEMRGEFNGDDPNDCPPSYDDVYDIKVPPPCFCKAIAMQNEPDLGQQPGEESTDAGEMSLNVGEAHADRVIELQNLGFECSCANINNEDNNEETEDTLPSYAEISAQSNKSNAEEGEHSCTLNSSADQDSGATHSANISPTQVDCTEFENVDLDKD